MGSLGATRGARPRAHVGVAVAAALPVLLVVGLLTDAQTLRWRSTAPQPRAAMLESGRRADALVTRSALRDDLDATSSDAVLPVTVASPRVEWRRIATAPVALEPIASAWWAATAARAPPDANASISR